MTAWIVRQGPSGWSVHKDKRQQEDNLDEDDAMAHVRRHWISGDSVVQEERDGYRTPVTRRMRRRR